jgi:hypothetical protein
MQQGMEQYVIFERKRVSGAQTHTVSRGNNEHGERGDKRLAEKLGTEAPEEGQLKSQWQKSDNTTRSINIQR